MSSYMGVLRESNVRTESPAKLFARMKSRVEKDAWSRGHGGTPASHPDFSDELLENPLSSAVVAEAITLSPISSPTRPPGGPFVSGLSSARNRSTRVTWEKRQTLDGQSRSDLPASHSDVFSPKMTKKRKLAVSTGHALNEAASPPKERRTEPRWDPIQETYGLRQSAVDRQALMSPVKALAYLRQRDSRSKQDALRKGGGETLRPLDKGLRSPARGLTPSGVNHSSPSDGEATHTVSPSPTESPEESPHQVVLFEDPLLVNSPKLEIPKKDKPLTWKDKSQCMIFPSKSEIYLTKWFPRRKHQGLFVDGLRREDNSPWNSNIVVERVSNSVVKTVSGKVYILCGKMATNRKSDFPRWFLRKFSAGFPPHWKELLDKFLSEGDRADDKRRTSNSSRAVVEKKPVKPSKSKPQLSLSRSGRVLRPPLEYWKGGRVTVDAHMNVTIYECYDTSVVAANKSPETSHQSKTFLPSDEGKRSSGSASDQGVSVKRRAAPQRRLRKAVSEMLDKPPSSKEGSRRLRDRQRQSDTQSQSEPESQGLQRPTRAAKKAQATRKQRNQIISSPEDEADSLSDLPDQDSVRRKKMSVKRAARRPASQTETNPKGAKDKPQKKTTRANKKPPVNKSTPALDDVEAWTEAEMQRLQQAVSSLPKHVEGYWTKVATVVGSRTAEECHNKRTSFSKTQSSDTNPKKSTKKKVETAKENAAGQALITARAGTLRRKQQVRQFLENMPTENTDDVFSCDFMQKKKFELPSMSGTHDLDFTLNDLEPMTPKSNANMEAKTPQCLALTPGMFGSPSRNLNDKYVFQLQKRMKKNQFNVHKPSAKSLTPSVPGKQMRRCGNTENETFVVWEMFPDKDSPQMDSSSQEDFYFSDSD